MRVNLKGTSVSGAASKWQSRGRQFGFQIMSIVACRNSFQLPLFSRQPTLELKPPPTQKLRSRATASACALIVKTTVKGAPLRYFK